VKFWLLRKEEEKTLSHGKPKRAKQGVGTIIGAAFIVMILLSGFAFYSLIQNNIEGYNKSASEVNASEWNRSREKLTVVSVRITNSNNLNITVENSGHVSSRLLWFGLFNESTTPEGQWFESLSEQLEPAETKNIISDFVVAKDQKYVIQLATEAGNTYECKFYPASEVACGLALMVAPPTIYKGNEFTVFLVLSNNDSEVEVIQNIAISYTVTPPGLVSFKEQPTSLAVESLRTGESAFFKWVCEGTELGTATLNVTYNQAPLGTYVTSTVNIMTLPAGGEGLVTITGLDGLAPRYPSQWKTIGGTQNVSGIIADLARNDLNPVVFRSNFTGTSANINHFVNNNSSNVDGSSSKGAHNSFPAQQAGPDGTFDTLTEQSVLSSNSYSPSNYNLLGSTQLISGTVPDLSTDNGVYMTYRSYPSQVVAQNLYTHVETTMIGGSPYYLQKVTSGDGTPTTLSATMGGIGRQLLGKFVYPLTSVSTIPASTWTLNYRGWRDNPATTITFDSASSVEASTKAATISWSHTTTTSSNRLLIVNVNIYSETGAPTTVLTATYGGTALTQIATNVYSATNPQVRNYIFQLISPQSGTQTITINFAASTRYACGAATYVNVDQTSPIQTSSTATGSSTSPSVSLTASGSGRAVFGSIAGYKTAPVTFQAAGTGSGTTGNPTPSYPVGLLQNDLILLQITVRDTTNTPTTPAGFTLLYGPDQTGAIGKQWIYYRFATGSETGTITITIGGFNCKIARMYSFRNVDLLNFYEGGGFLSDTTTTINAQSVTTTDANELAVSLNFVTNDNAVASFSGETGGAWAEAVAEFTTIAGSDGCVQLQTASMTSEGTISGGNTVMSLSDAWGVRAFALKPKATWIITEGSGQNNRWAKETYAFKGRASDKLNVAPGTVTMSWSTDEASNWVCSAVVINPVVVPVGNCDSDIKILKSDGTIRGSPIATNVANSGYLTSSASTLSGSYSWTAYNVVDPTDYLEIDHYIEVTTAVSGTLAYLRIDDASLPLVDQTRAANFVLPTYYTAEAEFLGSSNTNSWSQLLWSVDSRFSTSGVTATFQLYSYSTGGYFSSGDGFLTDTIGTSDITKTQTIFNNPSQFKDSSGNWRIKIVGTKATATQFDVQCDWVVLSPYRANCELDLEVQWTNVDYSQANEVLGIYLKSDNTYSLNGAGGFMVIGNGNPDWGSTTGTISFWGKMNNSVQGRFWGQDDNMETRWSGSNLVLDWGMTDSLISSYSFSANKWYFFAIVWNENNDDLLLYVGDQNNPPTLDTNSRIGSWTGTLPVPIQNRFLNALGGDQPVYGNGDDLRYWNIARSLSEIQGDYNLELTGTEPGLRSYFKLNNNFADSGPNGDNGSGSGTYSFSPDVPFNEASNEALGVDVWTGSSWQNIIPSLSRGWNNVSISPYLISSNLTLRFKDATTSNDAVQNQWSIDVSVLHLWTQANRYTAEVEFSGTSNIQNRTSFVWSVASYWDIGTVSVEIQLYNFTQGAFVTSGDGYRSFTSSTTPNTSELKSFNVSANLADFVNSTGGWRIKIKGAKDTNSQFLLKADLVELLFSYHSNGAIIYYDTWQNYTIKAASASGLPAIFAYTSIYANDTNVALLNAADNSSIANPAWVQLNINGEYLLKLKSNSTSSENFLLTAVVGTSICQKNITQEAP
jgi:hypothetical protein